MSAPGQATVRVVIEREAADHINTYVPVGMTIKQLKERSLSVHDWRGTIYFRNCPENGMKRGILDDFFEIHEPCVLSIHH